MVEFDDVDANKDYNYSSLKLIDTWIYIIIVVYLIKICRLKELAHLAINNLK